MTRRLVAWFIGLLGAVCLVICSYLLAAGIGGLIAIDGAGDARAPAPVRIYLLTNALHADFAIPIDETTRERYGFLREDGFPLDHPNLKYLVFGWGSRAFYTSAKTWGDIRPGPTLTAITGDRSVVHVVPATDISTRDNAVAVDLSQAGYERLLEHIDGSFAIGPAGPQLLDGFNYGQGDLFYEAHGGFDIFTPCNIWVANGLRKAGVSTGIWTPTTYSLLLSLRR